MQFIVQSPGDFSTIYTSIWASFFHCMHPIYQPPINNINHSHKDIHTHSASPPGEFQYHGNIYSIIQFQIFSPYTNSSADMPSSHHLTSSCMSQFLVHSISKISMPFLFHKFPTCYLYGDSCNLLNQFLVTLTPPSGQLFILLSQCSHFHQKV